MGERKDQSQDTREGRDETMQEIVQLEIIESIAVVSLNRPEARHALSLELMQELQKTLKDLENHPFVRVIVLTATGDKAFCSGADLGKTFVPNAEVSFLELHALRGAIGGLFKQIRSLSLPVIGAANGLVLAGGVGLLLSCDLTVASEMVQIGLPEVKRGIMPYMVMALLSRQIGEKRALEMVLTGESISAAQAYDWGLFNRVFPAEKFREQTLSFAHKIAQYSPLVMQMGKKAFYRQRELGFDTGIEYLHGQLSIHSQTEDAREGITSFLEKRPPVWKGK